MNQIYTSGRFIRRGLGCNCLGGFGDDMTDNADGGGGYYYAPPADSGSDYTDPNTFDPSYFDSPYYGSDYWDAANGVYYDTYGNVWSAPQVGADITIDSSEYDYWTGGDIDTSVLNQTPAWMNELNADPTIGILPAAHVAPQLILQIPDSGIVPPGLVLPPVLNALPPKKLAALKKALQNQTQKAAQAASSGASGSAASRPQTVQPSSNKTCPPGYTLNAAKTACMLNQAPSAATGFTQLLQNPLVWILVLGAVVLAKR